MHPSGTISLLFGLALSLKHHILSASFARWREGFMWKPIAVVAILSAAMCGAAYAQGGVQVIARCGPVDGFAYYFPAQNMASNETGWQRDQISNSSFMLIQDRTGSFDIVFTDATRRTISATSNGAEIFPLRKEAGLYVVLSVYSGIVETYMFAIDSRGAGSMTLSQTRHYTPPLPKKVAVMVAPCGG